MKIIIIKDYEELSRRGARVMLETVKGNPYAVLRACDGHHAAWAVRAHDRRS